MLDYKIIDTVLDFEDEEISVYHSTLKVMSDDYTRIGKSIDKDNFKVFMDPARAGAEKAVLDTLLQYKPSKIVYMSCNPETLVRDLKTLLSTKEYKITFATPYDMFPHTKHVEMLVALEKK